MAPLRRTFSSRAWLVQYSYVLDILEKRKPHREAHIAHAAASNKKGELHFAGAFADPVDGAAFIFRVQDKSAIETFIRLDPYVKNGLVTGYTIREWSLVIDQSQAKVG